MDCAGARPCRMGYSNRVMSRAQQAAIVAALCINLVALPSAQDEYVIGPQDVLAITVFDHADLSGEYEVERDGTLTFPLIGQVKASELTLQTVESKITELLADGYLRKPQVDIAVAQYRSQQVFVIGEVRSPGTIPFTGQMTLIEALARAGSATASAGNEVLVVRSGVGRLEAADPADPADDDDPENEVIRVDLSELQQGVLARNVRLKAGDTVVVQRAELVYVFGQVNTPGAYPIQPGTTVLQALTLAGGMTDRGADGRIDILRDVDGEQQRLRVRLDEIVEPGDTVVVPQRYF